MARGRIQLEHNRRRKLYKYPLESNSRRGKEGGNFRDRGWVARQDVIRPDMTKGQRRRGRTDDVHFLGGAGGVDTARDSIPLLAGVARHVTIAFELLLLALLE